jgi:hypothetical protein
MVDASMLTEQEKEWMEGSASQTMVYQTYDNANRNVERVVVPNLFDIHRNILKNP